MAVDINRPVPFSELAQSVKGEKAFAVRRRGRPSTDPAEAQAKEMRRSRFGSALRQMRENSNMTLAEASDAAGIASARKLSQYETTCYPPGWIVRALAPVYGVDERYLAALAVANEDPDMFEALTGVRLPEDFAFRTQEA